MTSRRWISAARLVVCAGVLSASGTLRADMATGALPISERPSIPRPAPAALNVEAPIPSNGAILISTMAGAATLVQLTQPSTSSLLIEGELRPLGQLWVWKPLEPLVPGTYRLTLINPAGTDVFEPAGEAFYAVTVIEAWTPFVPELMSAPSARTIDTPVETACCQIRRDDELVEGTVCLPTRVTSQALVSPGLTTTAPPEQRDQFLYRIRPAGVPADEEPTGFVLSVSPSGALFDEQADEYCFAIDAIDIVSFEIHADVAVEPRCVAHGALPSFEAHAVEVADGLLHRSVCGAPPAGFEARWCALNELECEAMPLACPLFGHVCRGDALPPAYTPPALSGGASGMSSGGAGGVGGAPSHANDEHQRSSSGCSAAPRATTLAPSSLWVVLAWLLAHAARGRARR